MVSTAFQRAKWALVDEDAILVDRFLGGDAEAFTRLYEAYYDKVYAIARGVLMDPDEAADAVQEVFALVHRHLCRFDRRSKFSTWLFRVAVNRSIQHARGLRHRSRLTPLTDQTELAAPEADATTPDPTVQAAMARLAPADRAVLTLFYWEELSLQEIAESLGCSANAAKTRLFRARERFRAHYEQETR